MASVPGYIGVQALRTPCATFAFIAHRLADHTWARQPSADSPQIAPQYH